MTDPENPVMICKKLADEFKKTWATRLDLRRKLHSLILKDGESTQKHVKSMVELFDTLSVAGETIQDEDGVVYLLASLLDLYNVLVTALEVNEDVPKLEVVRKSQERSEASSTRESAMTSCGSSRGKPKVKCYHCGRQGHIKKYCRDLKAEEGHKERNEKPTASQKAAAPVA